MRNRLGLLAAVCAALGVFVTGCGSSSTNTTATTTATTPAVTTPAATTPATTTPAATTPAATTPAVPNPASTGTSSQLKAAEAADPAVKKAVEAAVASCKTSINAAPTLTAGDKTKLDAICDKAGSGDTTGVQKATAEVCQEIVKDSVPASAQTQALAACPKP
ncbi:MAG TPA: hypothetical protein VHW26_12890 [Solirubrobacteraceae bacterium]|jgi:subtilase-type serine protease|nr:hypothetical protein [Solirubrobacteraceae bacterium]